MRSFMSNSIQSSSAADRARRNIRGEPKSPLVLVLSRVGVELS